MDTTQTAPAAPPAARAAQVDPTTTRTETTIPCRRCWHKVRAQGGSDDWGNARRGGRCFSCGGRRFEALTPAVAAECRAEAIGECKVRLDRATGLAAQRSGTAAIAAINVLHALHDVIENAPWWPADVVARARLAQGKLLALPHVAAERERNWGW